MSLTMTHFVTFMTNVGGGWTTVAMPQGFRSAADVDAVQEQLRTATLNPTLTITGWQRFEVEA